MFPDVCKSMPSKDIAATMPTSLSSSSKRQSAAAAAIDMHHHHVTKSFAIPESELVLCAVTDVRET
ncbi:hypothetical protein M422DRAFT_248729 [Sphaerobolus stellatus SS14]|nr:hypothetical protein M422DRAFT_248729 [Sphaerobolus stellatus SS14]